MDKIRPELENIKAAKKRRAEITKADKEREKRKKKAEDEEIKEMINNEKKFKAENKKMERSFERYYNGKA